MHMKWHTKLWKKIRGIFAPEVMVGGGEYRQPVNRKERRVAASIARKQQTRNRSMKR